MRRRARLSKVRLALNQLLGLVRLLVENVHCL
jgi:hypothetical protein